MRSRTTRPLAVVATLWLASLISGHPQAAARLQAERTAARSSTTDARALLDTYCVGCHNERARTSATASGMLLDRADLSRVAAEPELWEKVIRKVKAGAMPPAGMPRPDAAASDALVRQLETILDREATLHPDPGRSGPHRLNRAEYRNAIRDLLALDVDPAELLPPDDSAEGFDNNADTLGTSPALLEHYLTAAGKISALAVGSRRITAGSETYRLCGDGSQSAQDEDLPEGTRGGLSVRHTFPLDGEYVIKVKLLQANLGAVRGLQDQHQLEVTIDGERVLLAPVGGDDDFIESSKNATNVVNALDARLQVRVFVHAGPRTVDVAFLKKPSVLGGDRLQPFERTTLIATDHLGYPHVENVTISGPFNAKGPGDTPSRRRIFVCTTTDTAPAPAKASAPSRRSSPELSANEGGCARRIVSTLARRAYRRPVADADIAPLMGFVQQGVQDDGFERGIELALRAILVSPKFVFRVESDPPSASRSAGAAATTAYRITDLELASRLSFFLWSSIPDDELLDAAARGRLSDPRVLDAQVRRMLADDRASALVDNFAAQWLHMRNLRNASPDKNRFPDFDDNLRRAFERELQLFVGSIIREDRPVLDLLTANDTFVNERLARHYGIPNVYGPWFRRVTVSDERRGLLGKGGILLVTSHADRTSPVVRGKWILDNLIGTPPPPPPPDVPPLPDEVEAGPQTVRARMERHRANPACAGCHRVMDPLGLALENFDGVGRWRTEEAGTTIDASGVLTDGARIDGVARLREALLARPDVLVGTITEKLLTYALGRGLDARDMPAVRAIVRNASPDGYRFSSIVRGIVTSTPFQMRRAAS
jgi:mono/diheme cytochrome c family protein